MLSAPPLTYLCRVADVSDDRTFEVIFFLTDLSVLGQRADVNDDRTLEPGGLIGRQGR